MSYPCKSIGEDGAYNGSMWSKEQEDEEKGSLESIFGEGVEGVDIWGGVDCDLEGDCVGDNGFGLYIFLYNYYNELMQEDETAEFLS